jgi:hypothetical protein
MSRGKTREELQDMFNRLNNNWYSIYNWPSINSKSYLNEISDIILNSYDAIKLDLRDLREKNFWLKDSHIGTCQIKPTKNIQEKRICRAMFNYKDLGVMGNVRDYEVPLKGISKSKHGDIDLLSIKDNEVFIIEAKNPNTNTSIVKGILQAFTYCQLVQQVKSSFFSDFNIDQGSILIPSVLVFNDSECGKEMRSIKQYGSLIRLLNRLNMACLEEGNGRIKLFIITNTNKEVENSLVLEPWIEGKPKIIFSKEFHPEIKEIKYE